MIMEKTAMPLQTIQTRVKLVPPDGGWGWMVVIGAAVCNIFNQSLLSLFSLLYGDKIESMGHKTQGAALVLSTMLFFSNFGGPIAGAGIKLTSPRVIAVTGAALSSSGIFLSAFTTNIWHLVITYGVLLGTGLGFVQNSSFVAINSYFKERKSRAVGFANVGTGIGQTVMPHVVRYLLEEYGFKNTCLFLGALSLHGICGTLLIHPVRWHMKKVEENVLVDEKLHLLEDKHQDIVIRKDSKVEDIIKEARQRSDSNVTEKNGKGHYSGSLATLNSREKKNSIAAPVQEKTLLKKIYDLFDISLLSSPRFLNVIIGTALAVTSIQNFSMLFPFFLQKVAQMDKQQTANCMSIVALADIFGRIVLPTIQDKYRIKARWMLIMTCTWLIVVRQILAFQTDMIALMFMSALYGLGRSMIIVSRNIAISDNCRIDQVPAAVGLGMLSMGIIVPPAGYFLGWIRDYTGSFMICITAQNMLLVVLLVTWIPDMLLLRLQEKREQKKDVEQLQLS